MSFNKISAVEISFNKYRNLNHRYHDAVQSNTDSARAEDVANLVKRSPTKQEVCGSNPITTSFNTKISFQMDRGGGPVVSALAFSSDNLGSNLAHGRFLNNYNYYNITKRQKETKKKPRFFPINKTLE